MHLRLAHQGCRFVGAARGMYAAARQSLRGGLAIPGTEPGRPATTRAAAATAGGRRGSSDGRERDSGSASESAGSWGDDWDLDASKGSGGGGGWLSAADESSGRSGGRGGGWRERERGAGGSAGSTGLGGGEWRERRGGGEAWGDRRGSRGDRGRGGRDGGLRERDRGGRGGGWRERDQGGRGGGWRERDQGGRNGGRRERDQGSRDGGWQERDQQGSSARPRGRWEEEGGDRRSYERQQRGSWSQEDRGSRQRGGGGGRGGRGWEEANDDGWESRHEAGSADASSAGSGSSLRDLWVGDVLYGVSPVLAALQAGRRTVHALYLQDGMDLTKRKDKGAIQAAKRKAEELGARVEYASKHDLNMLADNRPHQGVMLDCSPLDFEPMPVLPPAEPVHGPAGARLPVWLCLDEVMDPQNFGAALRCAHFLGVDGVLTCHRNSAPLSAVVSKASAGAMELLPVHSTKSLPQTLADARQQGWQVLGAAAEPGAASAASFVLRQPTVLVMGNEGYGLRNAVRRLCDGMLQIDGGPAGSPGGGLVDSLNVSVATGILLHRLLTAQEAAAAAGGGDDSGPSLLQPETA
ncbi:hypothetical protein ABPG75_010609 [Micractinium tetrahymenae]